MASDEELDERWLGVSEPEGRVGALHRILKLNIGNPAPFGFEAPEAIPEREPLADRLAGTEAGALRELVAALADAHGLADEVEARLDGRAPEPLEPPQG